MAKRHSVNPLNVQVVGSTPAGGTASVQHEGSPMDPSYLGGVTPAGALTAYWTRLRSSVADRVDSPS